MTTNNDNPQLNASATRMALPGAVAATDVDPLSRRGRRGPTQGLVLLLVLGASAACLVAMRQMGVKSGIDMNQTKDSLPKVLSDNTPDKQARFERIMGDLQRISEPLDVALADLGASPFMRPVKQRASDLVASSPGMSADELAKLKRRERVESELSKVKLQSVMGGSVPIARINGKTMRVGDVVEEIFTITRIEGRSIVIEADGEEFEISMEAGGHGGKGNAPTPKKK